MADDIDLKDEEEKEEDEGGEEDFSPTKTLLTPSTDPGELEDDLLAGEPDIISPVSVVRPHEEEDDLEDYFYNGYDNDNPNSESEDDFN